MISLKDIRNFVEGTFLHTVHTFLDMDSHIKEQAIYRCLMCWDCYKNKRCTQCGCSTPAMFFSPNKKDSKNLWTKMLDKIGWEAFKLSKEFTNNLTTAYGNHKTEEEFLELLQWLDPNRRVSRNFPTNTVNDNNITGLSTTDDNSSSHPGSDGTHKNHDGGTKIGSDGNENSVLPGSSRNSL